MKQLKGYENLYSIDESGNVFSIRRNRLLKQYLSFKFKGLSYYVYTLSVNSKSKNYTVHRLLAENFIDNPLNLPVVDHINGDTTDNRLENLRWCTLSQNRINSKKASNKTSQYRGVSWSKIKKKWIAQGRINGKVKKLGSFDSEIEASKSYNEYSAKYHGEFVRN